VVFVVTLTLVVPQVETAFVYMSERDCRHRVVQTSLKEEMSMYSSGYWIKSEHPARFCERADRQAALTDPGRYPVPGITEIALAKEKDRKRVNAIMVLKRVATHAICFREKRRRVENRGNCAHRDLDMRSLINGQGHQSSLDFALACRCITQAVLISLLNIAPALGASDCVDVRVDALSVGSSGPCVTIQSRYCKEFHSTLLMMVQRQETGGTRHPAGNTCDLSDFRRKPSRCSLFILGRINSSDGNDEATRHMVAIWVQLLVVPRKHRLLKMTGRNLHASGK
jgi:hypothetical protein